MLTISLCQVTSHKNDSQSKLAQHHTEVYHKALDIVFDDVKTAIKRSVVEVKILGTFKRGMPIFMIVSADYEEM